MLKNICILAFIACTFLSGCDATYDMSISDSKEPFHCQYDEDNQTTSELDSSCVPDGQNTANTALCFVDISCSSGLKKCSNFGCAFDPQTECGNSVARLSYSCGTVLSGTVKCYLGTSCSNGLFYCSTGTCATIPTNCDSFIGLSQSSCDSIL